ncbi:transposase (plasmid) [Salmonella enterica subsp. enterica]
MEFYPSCIEKGMRSERALKLAIAEMYVKGVSTRRVSDIVEILCGTEVSSSGTVAKLAMRQPFVLFKGLTFQKLCLPGAFRPGDHHNKMLRPGLCVVHASPQYL